MLFAFLASALAATMGGLPRYPDIGTDRIVFTAGGDLWSVAVEGGTARRLTSEVGQERFARLSRDEKWIAYTAEYEGQSAVWVIPADGGVARRLTWHPAGWMDNLVWDWTADGKVLFTSRHQSVSQRFAELYTVSPEGELPQRLATSDAGPAAIAPDGSLIFNRHFQQFRTWKRYRGGTQQDLWRFDPGSGASQRLTTFPGTDTFPMIAKDGTLYFVSDQPEVDGHYGRRNLFRFDEAGNHEQLTFHTDYDVDWPALDSNQIVYTLAADLHVFDLQTKTDRALDVRIPDEALNRRARRIDVGSWEVVDYSIGPQGKRVSAVAHGDLFTVPAKEGSWRLVQGGSEGRVYTSAWSPDGKQIAYISDASGEQEVYLLGQDGEGTPRQLTTGNHTWIHSLRWSPDGSRVLFQDKRMRLWDVDVKSGVKIEVDRGETSDIWGARYSHDGTWIAYLKPDENGYGSIWLHNVFSRKTERLTDGRYHEYDLTWDPEARWLYFASKRNFDLVESSFEFRIVHRVTDYLYAVQLQDDGPDPVPELSDEEVDEAGDPIIIESDDEKDEEKQKKRKAKKKIVLPAPSTRIDFEGIGDRVYRLPIPAGRYYGLAATEDELFFVSRPAVDADGAPTLRVYERAKQEVKDVAGDVLGFELAAGGDKLLLLSSDGAYVTDASADAGRGDKLDLNGLSTWVDPVVEWRRTLDEVRRYYRDHFYDPGMHGHDWDAIHDHYAALLERATDSSDVIWLIGEMISELNVGHAYVQGGWDGVLRVSTGSLGAVLESDGKGIVIKKILRGEPGNDNGLRSPLMAHGVDAREGDYLVSIDGHPLAATDNPYRWLVGMVGKPVRIAVGSTPAAIGRDSVVTPIESDAELFYWDWVERNRARVAEATEGRVGYLHLPNTSTEGYTSFVREFYSQYRMDGLVVDVRYNSGGFIPDMFIEPMMRPHFNTWVPRDGADWRTPQVAHHGPKACIINGYAGSGGDAFPYYFRQFELGKLVGTTTWGGLVGIDNGLPLLIGGWVTAPSFGFVNPAGEWDVERLGVAPDEEVIDPPEALHKGDDPQLDAAIRQVLRELETWKDPVPPRPPKFPVRK